MSDPIAEFLEKLKDHLTENEGTFNVNHPWMGCTETGFYDQDILDMDLLLAEIDKFAASFKK